MQTNTNIRLDPGRYVAGTIAGAVRNGGYWIFRYTPRPPVLVPVVTYQFTGSQKEHDEPT